MDCCLQLNNERTCHYYDIASSSDLFSFQIKEILYNKYNINSYIYKEKSGVNRINIKGLTNAYLFGKLLYENNGICLSRKFNLFNQITTNNDIINRLIIKRTNCLSK